MNAIREIHEVTRGMVTITLPANFRAKRVEIIILPAEEPPAKNAQALQTLLLNAPTLNNQELQQYSHIWEWMNQWNVQEF